MKFKTQILLLTIVSVASPIFAEDEGSWDVERSGKKCLNVGQLTACGITVNGNETVSGLLTAGSLMVTGNETITGNETVSGLLTAGSLAVTGNASVGGALTLANAAIALTAGGDLLDYGFFSSTTPGALATAINLTADNVSGTAYTALAGGTGTGVTVANAGTYLVIFYAYGATGASWTINENGAPVAGGVFSNSVLATLAGPATGFAVVTVPTAGQTITLSGSNVVAPAAGNTVGLLIVRLR